MSRLVVADLTVGYGAAQVLHGVGLAIQAGEIVTLVGANGAGKSTLLKAVAGLLAPRAGRVRLDGEEIGGRPAYEVARRGLVLVPEGRGIFGDQTVRENLLLGALARREGRDAASIAEDLERHLALFPALRERLDGPAGGLSGGQQQMLALARGLMARPRVLLLDEPSMGLAPRLTREILGHIARLRRERNMTILLVEQNARGALAIADRGYVLETGRLVLQGSSEELLANRDVQRAYLGREPSAASG